jgi:hypothetical protein
MGRAQLHSTWDSLIGYEATEILATRAMVGLIPVALVGIMVAAASSLSGGSYYAVVGASAAVLLPTYVRLQARSNRRLAAAMSAHMGVPVSHRVLPRLLTRRVVEGILREGQGNPRREKSFLGGRVRFTLPPKK